MTPSEIRMAELCAIRRELTEEEQLEALRLSKRIRENAARRKGHTRERKPAQDRREYWAAYYRNRYENDAAFRERSRARAIAYKASRRGNRA